MKQIKPEDINIIYGLPPVATKDTIASWDTEWFGMNKKRLHRPHGTFASAAVTYDGVNVYYITETGAIPEFMSRIDAALWTGHNISFDIRQFRMFTDILPRKRVWDTMLIDQIRHRGYYDTYGLNDTARRECQLYIDKSQQKTFEDATELSPEKIFYGACDVVADWLVAFTQRERIDQNDLWIWQNIERPFMWTLLDIKGICLDVDLWAKIAKEKGDKAAAIWEQCHIQYGINIRSNPQIKEFLLAEGIKTPSVNAATLLDLQDVHPIVPLILEYRKPQKGASTYGMSWIDDYVEDDGLVYSSWNQIKAVTGRMSSDSPNLQNIPVREEPIYRDCFIAEEDYDLIISDWSSQEPRITAYKSEDEALTGIFVRKEDVYCGVGAEIFDEKFDKKDPRRKTMKSLVLGLDYGMTPYGLSGRIVGPLDDDPDVPEMDKVDARFEYAEFLVKKFFEKFPGVKKYITNQEKVARKQGYVETIYGRKCWISPYEKGLEREAPNYTIQGSAADAMKIAAVRIDEWAKAELGYSIVRMFVHDELVCSTKCMHSQRASSMIEKIMVEVAEEMHTGIPAQADVYVGKKWSEKK